MTVSSLNNKHVYTGNGVTVNWPYTFPIIDSSDILLYKTDSAGNVIPISSRFTIDTVNAVITYPTNATGLDPVLAPLSSSERITILRSTPLTQGVDLKNQGPFNAEVLEQEFDKLTMITQQLQEEVFRCIRYSVDSNPSSTETDSFLLVVSQAKADSTAAAAAALVSETNAAASASSALASKNAAATSASNASTSETNAATSASNASASASSAASSQSTASTAAGNASASQSAAATSAGNAATSESNSSASAAAALASKNAASTSASNAATSETNAAVSAAAAAASALTVPTLDTDGSLTANLDTKVASQKATKTYVDAQKSAALVLTNKDIDGATASNSSRVTLPKNTLTNLTALTRKEATVLWDTTNKKMMVDDGTNLKPLGGQFSTQNFTGTTLTGTSEGFQRWRYTGSSAQTMTAFTLTSVPDAGVITLQGTSDTNTITLNSSVTGIYRINGPIELGAGQIISFQYDSTLGGLCEVSRS